MLCDKCAFYYKFGMYCDGFGRIVVKCNKYEEENTSGVEY